MNLPEISEFFYPIFWKLLVKNQKHDRDFILCIFVLIFHQELFLKLIALVINTVTIKEVEVTEAYYYSFSGDIFTMSKLNFSEIQFYTINLNHLRWI